MFGCYHTDVTHMGFKDQQLKISIFKALTHDWIRRLQGCRQQGAPWVLTTVSFLFFEYLKKVHFCNLFQKVKLSYSRFITCKVKHSKCFIILFWWLELTAHENQKSSISKINKKNKDLQNEKFKFFKVCSFMHSLGRGTFSTNSSLSEVWHGSDHRCIDCFSSFSWKYPVDVIWGSGQAC